MFAAEAACRLLVSVIICLIHEPCAVDATVAVMTSFSVTNKGFIPAIIPIIGLIVVILCSSNNTDGQQHNNNECVADWSCRLQRAPVCRPVCLLPVCLPVYRPVCLLPVCRPVCLQSVRLRWLHLRVRHPRLLSAGELRVERILGGYSNKSLLLAHW